MSDPLDFEVLNEGVSDTAIAIRIPKNKPK